MEWVIIFFLIVIITIIIVKRLSNYDNGDVRFVNGDLMFDNTLQGSLIKTFPYINAIVEIAKETVKNGKLVVCIGLGLGAFPKRIHDEMEVDIQVVEIDPTVIKIAREKANLNFEMKSRIEPRINPKTIAVIQGDGEQVLSEAYGKAAFICLDAYNAYERIPDNLNSRSFIQSCWNLLEEGGVLCVNAFKSNTDIKSKLNDVFKKIDVIYVGENTIFNCSK